MSPQCSFLFFLPGISVVTVEFMIQPVWSTATPARNGSVTAVEIHPAGISHMHNKESICSLN